MRRIEQYDTKAEDVGPWSDIYALGMVAYRCISGLSDKELPDAVTRARNQRKGQGDLAPAETVGQRQYAQQLLQGIDRAIEVHEEARPQSIAAWRQALPAAVSAQDRESPQPPPPPPPPPSRWALVAGVVAFVVAVAGGAFWYARQQGVWDGKPKAVATRPTAGAPGRTERPAPPPRPTAEPSPSLQPTAPATPTPAELPVPEETAEPSPAEVEAGLELDREARRLVQQGLAAAGQDPGPADGLFGGETERTRQAIRAWQTAKGMEASGYLTQEQADTLMELGRARGG